jgi:hypothetical protein
METNLVQPGRAVKPGAPAGLAGTVWFGGWLFTIAFAKLVWWKAMLALIAWPYYLGLVAR